MQIDAVSPLVRSVLANPRVAPSRVRSTVEGVGGNADRNQQGRQDNSGDGGRSGGQVTSVEGTPRSAGEPPQTAVPQRVPADRAEIPVDRRTPPGQRRVARLGDQTAATVPRPRARNAVSEQPEADGAVPFGGLLEQVVRRRTAMSVTIPGNGAFGPISFMFEIETAYRLIQPLEPGSVVDLTA
jgi:hypothetical protein